MGFLWDFFVVLMLFSWYMHGLSMGLLWDSYGISMIFLLDSHEIFLRDSSGLLKKTMVFRVFLGISMVVP